MRTLIIAALFASAQAMRLQWPSVARCPDGTPSTNTNKCDNLGQGPWPLDPSFVMSEESLQDQELESWPSVARCADGTPSTNTNKCDNLGAGPWPLDPSFAQGEYRPVTKCVEGSTGYANPATCSYNDNSAKNQAYDKPAYIGALTP